MKKLFGILVLICLVLMTVGCPQTPPLPTYTVMFESNDGSDISSQVITQGQKSTRPTNPTKTSSYFAGWYKDNTFSTKWNFANDKVTADTTVYARWETSFADLPENTGVGIMKAITGGTFSQTANNSVAVDSFWLGETEVTQKQWKEVMGSVPDKLSENSTGDDYPVHCVSWYMAVEFCNALSEDESLEKVYTIDKINKDPNNDSEEDDLKWTVTADFSKNGYRLPTLAEWQYAAGGGAINRTDYAGTNTESDLGIYAVYNDGTPPNKCAEVGTKTENQLGLFDMNGNLEEWCWDYLTWSINPLATDNPTGPNSGDARCARGGSYEFDSSFCHINALSGASADATNGCGGFRVARSL